MQARNSNSWRVVTDPAAIHVLFDIEHRARLAPFFENARTVGEVARRLQEEPKGVYYHVSRYVKLGLLAVVRTEARAGKPLRYYRATAEWFFVPLAHILTPDLEGALNDFHLPLLKLFIRNVASAVQDHLPEGWGRRLFLDAQGNLVLEAGPAPYHQDFDLYRFYARDDFPAACSLWQEVYLSPDEAKALQLEFNSLSERLERFQSRRGEGRERYLVKVGITPLKKG